MAAPCRPDVSDKIGAIKPYVEWMGKTASTFWQLI